MSASTLSHSSPLRKENCLRSFEKKLAKEASCSDFLSVYVGLNLSYSEIRVQPRIYIMMYSSWEIIQAHATGVTCLLIAAKSFK